eukprot:459277_1
MKTRMNETYYNMVGAFMNNIEDGVSYKHWVKDMNRIDESHREAGNKQHHKHGPKMILPELYNECLNHVNGFVKTPSPALGNVPPGHSLAFDKGTPSGYMYTMEYNRTKFIGDDGYPSSCSIYQHPITDEEGKVWTKATRDGLSANKKFVFNAMTLNKEEASRDTMGLHTDRQYDDNNLGVHGQMKQDYELTDFMSTQSDAAHLVESGDKLVAKNCGFYQILTKTSNILTSIYNYSKKK